MGLEILFVIHVKKRNNKNVVFVFVFFPERTMVLLNLSPGDTGSYACNASNKGGSVQEIFHLTVNCNSLFSLVCLHTVS